MKNIMTGTRQIFENNISVGLVACGSTPLNASESPLIYDLYLRDVSTSRAISRILELRHYEEKTEAHAYGLGKAAAERNDFDEELFLDNKHMLEFYCAGYRHGKSEASMIKMGT